MTGNNIPGNLMDIVKQMKPVPVDERETIINMSAGDDTARVYTSDRRDIARYLKLCEKAPKHYQVQKYDSHGVWFTIQPKTLIRLFSSTGKQLTEEERAERVSRLYAQRNDEESGAA